MSRPVSFRHVARRLDVSEAFVMKRCDKVFGEGATARRPKLPSVPEWDCPEFEAIVASVEEELGLRQPPVAQPSRGRGRGGARR